MSGQKSEAPVCEAASDAVDGLYLISELVLPWTDVAGVGALAQASKPWLSETQAQALWRDFVVARWRVVPKHAPRVYGAPTWQLVYRNFLFQLKIPRSPYSRSTQAVFGRGRLPGVCTAWVLVKHRPDCRTHRSNRPQQQAQQAQQQANTAWAPPNQEQQQQNMEAAATPNDTITSAHHIMSRTNLQRPSIELRVLVQNTGPRCASLRVEVPHQPVHIMRGNSMTRAPVVGEYPKVPHLVSINGERHDSSGGHTSAARGGGGGAAEGGGSARDGARETLGPLDFGVYSVQVEAKGCAFETDFLSRARQLDLLIHSRETPSQPEKSEKVQIRFVDEATVWEHYEELPGGFMVLVDSPRTRFTTTEERFGRA